MLMGDVTIGLPTEGVNNADPPFEIGDYQAQELKNLRVVSGGLESIRPSVPFSGYLPFSTSVGAVPRTDAVLVFRPTRTSVKYLFAHAGRVYVLDTTIGVPRDIGYIGTVSARIRMLQFKSRVYIMNGVDPNYVWDGINLWEMGIAPPNVAPALQAVNPNPGEGTECTYYYTYYNGTWDVESDPSPAMTVTDFGGSGVYVDPAKSDDPQVDKIRIYRTGEGVTSPRLADEIDNKDYGATEYVDDSLDVDVSQAQAMALDHAKPPVLARGHIHNNRLVARTIADDTVWVSNEYEPQYMPVLPFIEQDQPWSGGPIEINPGDGGAVQAVVSWGGALIAFKDTTVYRIQEAEVGFYSYQSMGIPPCIAPESAVQTPYGLVYLSTDGFLLLTSNEQVVIIGAPVKYTSDDIVDPKDVAAISVDGYYVVSFKSWRDETWRTMTYTPDGGWQGVHDILVGSSYYLDTNGVLYLGRTDLAGISQSRFRVTGVGSASSAQEPERITWRDKAREFSLGRYSRIRQATVIGKPLGNRDQNLTFNVYDQLGNLLSSEPFVMTQRGSAVIGINDAASGGFLACEITGSVDRPVRIYQIRLLVEIGARIHE